MLRPSAREVASHPFFWSTLKRLNFFTELSDRLEHESSSTDISRAIEINGTSIVEQVGVGLSLSLSLRVILRLTRGGLRV